MFIEKVWEIDLPFLDIDYFYITALFLKLIKNQHGKVLGQS